MGGGGGVSRAWINMLSKPVSNDLYHGDNTYCFFAPQASTLLKIQHTIQEAQQHMQKVELTTVLTNGSNDRYMVERESVCRSRHGKFGIWGKFRSLCSQEEKWGKEKKNQHKSELKWLNLSGTVVHGAQLWWKPKKKMDIPLSVMNKSLTVS